MRSFVHARTPRIEFGAGAFARLPALVAAHGRRALVLTGARSHLAEGRWEQLVAGLAGVGATAQHAAVTGEPSPEDVDLIVSAHAGVDVVVAWGGGSVIDAGKAVSAMLPVGGPVARFLEGLGEGPAHDGRKLPFLAVPTTAGTGSEATKNAVLSRVGPDGFKKSLRHESFVPDVALVDPALALSCPPDVTAACGLDAVTQLLEAFVSTKATPLTDSLARDGLRAAGRSLLRAVREGQDLAARTDMAYAALLSGIALANAGLGVVHGLAGPLGARVPIPHGVACGTLLAAATRRTLAKLAPEHEGWLRYAEAGRLLADCPRAPDDEAVELLLKTLAGWQSALALPRLRDFGLGEGDLDSLAAAGDSKNSPAPLDAAERRALLAARL